MRILIVDDEPLAVERLRRLCARIDGAEVAGESLDSRAGLALAGEIGCDVVLLDISMPGMGGLEVARALAALNPAPAVIFVTAHPDFAVEAFDLAAVDYLLKPVDLERLRRAINRAESRPAQRAFQPLPSCEPAPASGFWVPTQDGLVRLAAEEITWVEAERDYMRLHSGRRSYLLHTTLADLQERLGPQAFLRIHRSALVRRDAVHRLFRQDGGWRVALTDGSDRPVGRTYLEDVRALQRGLG